jgi:hypothetical protein
MNRCGITSPSKRLRRLLLPINDMIVESFLSSKPPADGAVQSSDQHHRAVPWQRGYSLISLLREEKGEYLLRHLHVP